MIELIEKILCIIEIVSNIYENWLYKNVLTHKFIRTEDDRISLERIDGMECRINVDNAQTNDTGLWVFKIGTIENEIYKEVELKHIVKVDKSKFY